jgi:hypothetical protein
LRNESLEQFARCRIAILQWPHEESLEELGLGHLDQLDSGEKNTIYFIKRFAQL